MPERTLSRRQFLQEAGAVGVGMFLNQPIEIPVAPPRKPVRKCTPERDPQDTEISHERFMEDTVGVFNRVGTKVESIDFENFGDMPPAHEQEWKKGWMAAFSHMADAAIAVDNNRDAFYDSIQRLSFRYMPELENATHVDLQPSDDLRSLGHTAVYFGKSSSSGLAIHLAANQAPRLMLNWSTLMDRGNIYSAVLPNAAAYLVQDHAVSHANTLDDIYKFSFDGTVDDELQKVLDTGRHRSIPAGIDKQVITAISPLLLQVDVDKKDPYLTTYNLLRHQSAVIASLAKEIDTEGSSIVPGILSALRFVNNPACTKRPLGTFSDAIDLSIALGHMPPGDIDFLEKSVQDEKMYTVAMADGSGETRSAEGSTISGPAIETMGIQRFQDNFTIFPLFGFIESKKREVSLPIYISPDQKHHPVSDISITSYGSWGYIILNRDDIPGGVPEDGSSVQFSVTSDRYHGNFEPVFNGSVRSQSTFSTNRGNPVLYEEYICNHPQIQASYQEKDSPLKRVAMSEKLETGQFNSQVVYPL